MPDYYRNPSDWRPDRFYRMTGTGLFAKIYCKMQLDFLSQPGDANDLFLMRLEVNNELLRFWLILGSNRKKLNQAWMVTGWGSCYLVATFLA